MIYEQLDTLIETAIRRQDVLLLQPIDTSQGRESPLFGDGHIDSLTLVSILVDLEDIINQHYKTDLRLADISNLPVGATPFSTVGMLTDYVANRLNAVAKR